MEQEEIKRFMEKYLKTDESKNFVKGILALGVLRDAIASKVDIATKEQFQRHAKISLESLEKKLCEGCKSCSNCENLCADCNVKFYRSMEKVIKSQEVSEKYCLKNSPKSIVNQCEFVKCFISTKGYENINEIGSIDCFGLMEIIKNNKEIRSNFGQDIAIFDKVIQFRHIIHHSELTLHSKTFEEAVDTMIKLLTDQIDTTQVEDGLGQQHEDMPAEVSNKEVLVEGKPLQRMESNHNDLEMDAEPEIDNSVGSDRPIVATSENNKTGMPLLAEHRKEMEEAVKYLKMLKSVNFCPSSQNWISFLQIICSMVSDSKKTAAESLICSCKLSDHLETVLKGNNEIMPPELKLGYVDALILYCESDRKHAIEFQEHLQMDIEVQKGATVEAILYNGPELGALCELPLNQLEFGIEHSIYVFIYLTKRFVEDSWSIFSANATLMKAIDEKRWNVVPVWTEKRGKTFKVPFGLNALNGRSYYINDEFYRKGMSELFNGKMIDKKQKNMENQLEQIMWLYKKKKQLDDLAKKERDIELLEGKKLKELKLK